MEEWEGGGVGGWEERGRVMVPHMSASTVHEHRQNSVAPHVCVYCTRTWTEHPEHIRHFSRVSSCGSCSVFVSCGEAIAR